MNSTVLEVQFVPIFGFAFDADIIFSEIPNPNFPTVEELDAFVQQAFQPPAVLDLITELQALDPVNPFQTTQSIQIRAGICTSAPSPTVAPQEASVLPETMGPSSTIIPSSTVPPVAPSPAPTAMALDRTVQASPFLVAYNITGVEPDELEMVVASEVTLTHIEDFIVEQFSSTFDLSVESFDGILTEFGTNPVAIAYSAEVTFSEGSLIPMTSDVDDLIQIAFLEPPVLDLLGDFQELPPPMPFRDTESVEYFLLSELRSGEHAESLVGIGLGAGVSAAFLVALYCFWMRWRSRRRTTSTLSKAGGIPFIMPSHSYTDSIGSSNTNLMHFRDEDTVSMTSMSVRSVASETRKICARPFDAAVLAAHASETQKHYARSCESTAPFHSADLDIQPV